MPPNNYYQSPQSEHPRERVCKVSFRGTGDDLADVVEIVKQLGIAVLKVEKQMRTEGVQSPFSKKGSDPPWEARWNYTSSMTTGTARTALETAGVESNGS